MKDSVQEKPFHDAIVDEIHEATESLEFLALAGIINRTVIPANHDAIIDAWNTRLTLTGQSCVYDVPAIVLAKKKAIATAREAIGDGDLAMAM